MGLRFIFMLTRNDRTVADASQHLQTALSLGVRHIGFKDIGLPIDQLKSRAMKGATTIARPNPTAASFRKSAASRSACSACFPRFASIASPLAADPPRS